MTISVTQINNYIHGMLDIDGVLNNASVYGEVTNVKRSRDGWYFSLKDDSAAINCFCYENSCSPVVGSVVVAEGQINYFVKTGNVSFFVRRLTATDNVGAAYLRFVELKEKLQKEGLFDEAKKKPVPHCCDKIGVVTSETGAVIHDITNVVLRRQPFTEIILYPVKVQGIGADEEIARGVDHFGHSDVDAVIVGRGGGSNEDLSVFNSEIIVRAIANCPKPIVSAVGHGIDYTLCDFAADKRAVTPTEAAEFLTIDCETVKKRIRDRLVYINNFINDKYRRNKERISFNVNRINAESSFSLERAQNAVKKSLIDSEQNVKCLFDKLNADTEKSLLKISSLNPANLLKRGYGYVTQDGRIVSSVDDLDTKSEFIVTMSDGKIIATVKEKEKTI